MNNLRPAFEALTVNLVGQTITLRSAHTQVTGLLTGIYVDGWTTSTYGGPATVEDVNVSVRFDLDGAALARLGDAGLLISHLRGAIAQRRLGGGGVGDGTAAGAADELLIRQVVEVAPCGRR